MSWMKYHALFLGLTGSGKTWQSLKWFSDHSGCRIFIDTKGEVHTDETYRKVFDIIIEDFADYNTLLYNLSYYVANNTKIAIVPPFKENKRNSMFKAFLEDLWEVKAKDDKKVVLLVDEVHMYNKKVMKLLRSITLMGRSKNLVCGVVSQGWSLVDKNLRRNCLLKVILEQNEAEISELMDENIIPFEKDERGWRQPKVKFDSKYKAYAYIGSSGGKLVRLN